MTKIPLLMLAALAIVLAGCSAPWSNTAKALEWERVVPAGDCQCADGSEFAFWERRADPKKVVLFLNGGDACWEAKSCAFTGNGQNDFSGYDWSLRAWSRRTGAECSTPLTATTRSLSTRTSM